MDSKYHIETSKSDKFLALIGIDTSDDSFNAAENLWKFIDKNRAEVSLINVIMEPSLIIPPDAYIYIDIDKIMQEACLVSEELLDIASKKLQEHGVNVVNKYHVVGEVASSILMKLKTKNITL